ncbi:sulfite exporter TauE/SafE family protein [Halomonas sp. M5N1S17]|uniref:sulfite exporter TauE/SafE family protein n=1 Tax=Halomonas alkalisoli TaxID=2907158 RepID=UPI001F23FFA2|nr:sulfite exporter TauE/SafE family protein [Halomonas alkalisoli]MCE9666123.1 sulfite exporter TauE/SafE family protein [Halomonas alkalisoli]
MASTLQAATGFGFSVLATPLLFLIFEPHQAIQINIIISLIISFTLYPELKKNVDKRLLGNLIKGAIIGTPIGVVLIFMLNEEMLKIFAGVVILSLTSAVLLKLNIQQKESRDMMSGMSSGALTTSLGMPGPPLLLYFSSTNLNKHTLRSTTLVYFIFIYLLGLIAHVSTIGSSWSTWMIAAALTPMAFAGILAGRVAFKLISQKTFKMINISILLATGVSLIATSLK